MEWVLTYAVHSTALIAAVWLLTSVISKLTLGTREALWKAALFGPLVTATVVTATDVPSLGGSLPVPAALRPEAPGAEAASPTAASALEPETGSPSGSLSGSPSGSPVGSPVVERRIVRHRAGELEITAVRQRQLPPTAVAAPRPVVSGPAEPSPWPWILLGLWGLGAALGLGRLGRAAARLRTQLKGRRDVIEDPVLEGFLDLCGKAALTRRPRLTASAHLRSPIARGQREICVPERAIDSLSPEQQQAMLAHEIAHLLRHDPLWMVVIATMEAVFFFQPLNHLARRKIQEVAEYQCDDWAAQKTGTGVHLAKCLAEVAAWVHDGPPARPPAVAMADRGSPVVRRITRLLHPRRSGGRVHPVGRVALTVGSLGLVIAAVPRVSRADAEPAGAIAPTTDVPPALGAPPASTVTFVDHSDDDHDRSTLRLRAGDEVVEIEVQARHPEPPPAPEAHDVIILGRVAEPLGGGQWGRWWGGWWGGGWGSIELYLPSPLPFDEGYGRLLERIERRERAQRSRRRASRRRERAERHREHAERAAQRSRESAGWPSIFGVSLRPRGSTDGRAQVVEL